MAARVVPGQSGDRVVRPFRIGPAVPYSLKFGRCLRHRWYHTFVEKTTLYLSEDLRVAVKRAAAERGVSEAEIIRESIRASVGGVRPRPRGALYSSGQPIARRAEELLAGFGER